MCVWLWLWLWLWSQAERRRVWSVRGWGGLLGASSSSKVIAHHTTAELEGWLANGRSVVRDASDWGFGRLQTFNATHAQWDFFHNDETIADSFMLVRQRHSAH